MLYPAAKGIKSTLEKSIYGIYYKQQNTRAFFLKSTHTVGRRSGVVDTHLAFPEVSRLHATIQWTGNTWIIRDTSSNGIWLDGHKIQKGQDIRLTQGSIIKFSNSDLCEFEFSNDSEPMSLLHSLNENGKGDVLELEGHAVAVPSEKTLSTRR